MNRYTSVPLHPAKPWGSFPMSVVNWESKDMFRDYFFSENAPRNCAADAALCFPHCNHIKQFN